MIANQSHRSEWNEIYTMQTSYKYQKLIQCLRLLMTGQVQVGRKSAVALHARVPGLLPREIVSADRRFPFTAKRGAHTRAMGCVMLQTVYIACRWTCYDSVDHSISRWWLFTKVQL